MAAEERSLNETKTKPNFRPVAVRSKRIVNELNSRITFTINTLSNDNVYWSQKEKEECKYKFSQVYYSHLLIFPLVQQIYQ